MSSVHDPYSSPVLHIAIPLADILSKLSDLSHQVYDVKKFENPSKLSQQWEQIESLTKQAHQLIADFDHLNEQI